MLEAYLQASIRQARERARILKGKIKNPLPSAEYSGLQSRCEQFLDELITKFDELANDEIYHRLDKSTIRMRLFVRSIGELGWLECSGIAALNRHNDDDVFLNRLVFTIHQEINYPLNPPAACCLSQNYYMIDPRIGLLSVPLAESEFLLHLPDLYHELGHPLITTLENPRVEGFQKRYMQFVCEVEIKYSDMIIDNQRLTGPKEYYKYLLESYNLCWAKYWAREIFCDLFALYTLGPAYAWAHLHLTAKTDSNPFSYGSANQLSTHPPNQARMEALLIGLDLLGKSEEALTIGKRWAELLKLMGVHQDSNYRKACPQELIKSAASNALLGVQDIGCRIAGDNSNGIIHSLLNEAWRYLWTNPRDYYTWEKNKVKMLREKYNQLK